MGSMKKASLLKKKTAKKAPKKAPKKAAKKAAKKAPMPKISRDEEYLLILIAATERNITDQGTGIDEFFTQQANRLRLQLENLRAK